MLLLILADGHNVRVIEQNIRGLQDRIDQQTGTDRLDALAFALVLRHALEPADRGEAVEHPGQLGVLFHIGLAEDGAGLRVDAAGDVERGDFARLGAEVGGLDGLGDGDRVEIDDAEDVIELILHLDPLAEGADIVADVQFARGLNA